jgi:hypothetical protein
VTVRDQQPAGRAYGWHRHRRTLGEQAAHQAERRGGLALCDATRPLVVARYPREEPRELWGVRIANAWPNQHGLRDAPGAAAARARRLVEARLQRALTAAAGKEGRERPPEEQPRVAVAAPVINTVRRAASAQAMKAWSCWQPSSFPPALHSLALARRRPTGGCS